MLKKTEKTNLRQETIYDVQIRKVREKFIKRFIHEGLKPREVVANARHAIVTQTAQNFLRRKTKRPTFHTLLAIADGIGMEMIFQEKSSGKVHATGRGKVLPFRKAVA